MIHVKNIFLAILLLTTLVTSYTLLAEPKQKLYAKTKVILDNLSRPAIENIDKQGRIYFTTYDTLDLNKFTLERFDPITGKVEELVKIQPCRIREGREIH
ncbi:MAG TPA: hypothetical protein ENG40_00690 [Thermoprotei archaeon]|nr:hypothetical protein [Thermoprotei archaeon]